MGKEINLSELPNKILFLLIQPFLYIEYCHKRQTYLLHSSIANNQYTEKIWLHNS